MKIKSCVQILLLIVIILIVSNCNLDIDPPEQKSLIDSLYVAEQCEYNIGDTLNLICVPIESENDTFQYKWNSVGGVIKSNNNRAIVTSVLDSKIIVFCKVTNSSGEETTRSLEINFVNKVFIHGHIDGFMFDQDTIMNNLPFTISYGDYEIMDTTDSEGNFIIEFPGYPGDFNILVDMDRFWIDTLINFNSLNQIALKRFSGLNILTPHYNNFFPIAIGNKWTYQSQSNFIDDFPVEIRGTENWEIIEFNETQDTFVVNVIFDGQELHYNMDGEVNSKNIHNEEEVTLYYRTLSHEESFMKRICSWSKTQYYLGSPGMQMLRYPGMLVIHPEKEKIIDNSYGYWEFQYGIGLLKCETYSSDYDYKIELISYDINS